MPEVSIKSPDEAGAEAILRVELKRNFDAAANGRQVIFKLALPDAPDLYSKLTTDKRVAWVVALSGGYTRADACKRFSANRGMIASFSRARAADLRSSMSDDESEAALANPSTRFTGLDIQDLMPGCHLPTA
jgi:fructose-bisphosphate aldolase, class I